MLLVPATIVAVTAYAEQQQQQQQQNADKQLQETHANGNNNNRTNTIGSVGNTGTDDSNPEYNSTKAAEDPALTEEQIHMRVNELIDEIGTLYLENWDLDEAISDEGVVDKDALEEKIAQNNQTINTLRAELDILYPIPPDIYIPEEDLERLENAEEAVFKSGLPWFTLHINRATATLDVVLNIDYAGPDTAEKVLELTKDAPVVITYAKNNVKLQSGSCNTTTGYCNPLVGGARVEEKDSGLPCTISLAANRTAWWGLGGFERGVILPNHCNKKSTYYYQPSNDNAAYKIGKESKDGGWHCDCDFIKSDTRSVDGDKIHTGTSEYTLKGRANLVKNDAVILYGSTSGHDMGMVEKTGLKMSFYPDTDVFENLYKIKGIAFTDGDSGAPIINAISKKYGGMHIAGTPYCKDTVDNPCYSYGHTWTFLKEKLELN